MKGISRAFANLARTRSFQLSRSARLRMGVLATGLSATFMSQRWSVMTKEVTDDEDFGDLDYLDSAPEFSEDVSLPTASGAKHVIGKELEALVTKPQKDVFILKYTAHCPSCLIFRTLTEQLAAAFKDVDTITIGLYRSDLNFCNSPAYTKPELVSDPVPKLFPAVKGKKEVPGIAMELKISQSEAILKWLYDNCTHKFDYDAVLKKLRETHAITDETLISRYEAFNYQTGLKDSGKADWNNKKAGSYHTFYSSLCDPWNPCAKDELRWFATMMTYRARSASPEVKDQDNHRQLEKSIDCKLSPQYEAYIKAVSEFALNQMDQIDFQRAKREGKPPPEPSS